jgi:hypothetical protein
MAMIDSSMIRIFTKVVPASTLGLFGFLISFGTLEAVIAHLNQPFLHT